MEIIRKGNRYRGECSHCGCVVEVSKKELHKELVSDKYPKDSIGWDADVNKHWVTFVRCPDCTEEIRIL